MTQTTNTLRPTTNPVRGAMQGRRTHPWRAVAASLLVVAAAPANSTEVAERQPAMQLAQGRPANEVLGVWIDHTGRGAVEMTRCGAAVCGHIVWLQKGTDDAGKPLTDGLNPDARLRGRPICGLQVIGGATMMMAGTYDNGWIYNPEDGGRYSVELRAKGADQLIVHGYAGIKFLGETHTWKRAPASLVKCNQA